MNEILDLFFNQVAREAATGRVDCGIMQNVLFKTNVYGRTLYKLSNEIKSNQDFIIPTLEINDFDNFCHALIEYYLIADNFYKNISEDFDRKKLILTSLFNNANVEDFKNPVDYIKRRTYFILNPIMEVNKEIDIGYSEVLESNIYITLKKEPINEETPYGLYIKSVKDKEIHNFPIVRFGVVNNQAYFYAVQDDKYKKEVKTDYNKKINRKLYKVNENFLEPKFDNNSDYPENLNAIVPSQLLSLTICLSLLEKMNIERVLVSSFLPIRYNSKEILYIVKKNQQMKKDISFEKIKNEFHDNQIKHEELQRNLSDKFLREFRRLDYIFNNFNITSYPFELDSYSHFKLSEYDGSNNPFLNEIYSLVKNQNNLKK